MLRKTLTILSLVGLLLSVGLWGVSYFNFYANLDEAQTFLLLSGGALLCEQEYESNEDIYRKGLYDLLDLDLDFGPRGSWGFIGYRGLQTRWWPSPFVSKTTNSITIGGLTLRGESQVSVTMPFWPLVMLFGSTLWLAWMPLHRRRKRKKLGLCVKCGYDLRASKGRCPECNTQFESHD